MSKMRCPFCKKALMIGPKKAYETSAEHALDPNKSIYENRITYICNCADSVNCFWNEEGEYYGNPRKLDFKFHHAALDSFAREMAWMFIFSNFIRKFLITKYKYDKSYQISRFVFDHVGKFVRQF